MDVMAFVLFLAATFAAGATGALFPTGSWYKSLNKPSWVPPNWLFPVAWTSIYLLIAFAGARVAGLEGSPLCDGFLGHSDCTERDLDPGILRAAASAGVNSDYGGPLVRGSGSDHYPLATRHMGRNSFPAYLAWVSVAAVLNVSMLRLNPEQKPLDLGNL